MDDTLLKIFIAVTTFAIVIQAGILVGLYLAVRKSTAKMEGIAEDLKSKAIPTLDTVQSFLVEARPKLDTVTTNVSESSALVKNQLARIDATLTDALDRTRLQVIRGDELLSRTLDRVEQTSEIVHKTVVSPVRQISGLVQGITVGLEFLFASRSRRNGGGPSGCRIVRRVSNDDRTFDAVVIHHAAKEAIHRFREAVVRKSALQKRHALQFVRRGCRSGGRDDATAKAVAD